MVNKLIITIFYQQLNEILYIFIAEEDIYEDAEEDDFEHYDVGAGDAPYILPTGKI